MAVKTLQGTRIAPKGNRFQQQSWQNGYAFGGWIYGVDVNIGLSNDPTEVTIKVALANLGEDGGVDYDSSPIKFDIGKADLKLGSPNNVESLFDIYINGKEFPDFILYSYDVSIEADTKLLTAVFKDYSLMLDKVYVGLINRQGNKFVHRGVVSGQFSVQCADCQQNGSTFVENADLVRDVNFGSYAGLNGQLVDNFASVASQITPATVPPLTPISNAPSSNETFNLNGGYLILGTEDIPQSNCGALPEVKYSFPELVWSLKARGVDLMGAFPTSYDTQMKYYRQNYVGTLREVLQNWCSDFALDFHTSGKSFEAYSIKDPIDIAGVTDVIDPTKMVGANFDLTEDNAVSSYSESASLDNSFEQSVITYSMRESEVKTSNKSFQRHVGYMPMHPVDFNYSNFNVYNFRQNSYGLDFITEADLHDWELCSPLSSTTTITSCGGNFASFTSSQPNRYGRFHRWTNRTFGDLDTSMALAKYDANLRDIYAGTRIVESLQEIDPNRNGSYNVLNAAAKTDFDAHFKALGFQPISRILDNDLKETVLTKFKTSNKANARDGRFFEVYLGYYFPEEHQNVKQWEAQAAEDMYKFGYLVQGTNNTRPYVSTDHFYNLSPSAGLVHGSEGLKRTVYSHTYEPNTQQYPKLYDSPFRHMVPFTGLHPINRYTGAFIGTLDNHWGTSAEGFTKGLEFADTRCQQYGSASVNERMNDLEGTTEQTWDMSYFAPSFHSDIDDTLYGAFEDVFQSLSLNNSLGVDQISTAFYNEDGTRDYACQKLHFCIIPITFNNPNSTYSCHANGRFNFNANCGQKTINPQMYVNYQNEVYEEEQRKQKEKIPSICDLSVEEELCKKALVKKRDQALANSYSCLYDQNSEVSKYYCDIDPTGNYRVGFHPNYLSPQTNPAGNSRFLDVTVERNPVALINNSFVPTDDAGDQYIFDLADGETIGQYEYAWRSSRIIYPVYTPNNDIAGMSTYDRGIGKLYYGLMNTNVEEETRIPQGVEIYGEPVNMLNNNASMVKVINNEINPNLDPVLDGATNKFLTYTSLVTEQDTNSVLTIEDYHNVIRGLNDNSSNKPLDSVSFSILGEPEGIEYMLTPKSGLSSFSLSMGDKGVTTSLSYHSKSKTLPAQETTLNNITMRLPK